MDDGSSDNTSDIVQLFPSVTLISNEANVGKSAAMAVGISAAKCDLLMLLDADLKGLASKHIDQLAQPVLRGHADMSISLRRNSLLFFRLIGLDFVSGERVIRREIVFEALAQIRTLPRFGIEVFMNDLIVARKLSIWIADWADVTQSRKTEKLGFLKGVAAELRMLLDLAHVRYPWTLVSQTLKLMRLRITQ